MVGSGAIAGKCSWLLVVFGWFWVVLVGSGWFCGDSGWFWGGSGWFWMMLGGFGVILG